MILPIDFRLLTSNEWSRPQNRYPINKMNPINHIIMHWIGVPRQRANQVWQFFEDRKNGNTGYGSAHFIIDLTGDIIQSIPQDEMAYHVGSKTYTEYATEYISSYPNNSTLGIEMCHTSWEGEMTDNTWKMSKLLAYLLLMEYNLDVSKIKTHHDVVGWKECPRWFVSFPEEFDRFKDEIHELFKKNIVAIPTVRFLNVRDDVMGNKLGTISKNDSVELVGYKDGWPKIKKDNLVGYCSPNYLNVIY